ncbi:MAG: pyridoxamine 5'-phosphate oxidase family protein [Hyphomicrobiales bacterium]|nr:pyridoxamine 5'-phosphate oxidase family protein [Hyphomicrobiales bacterium]
MSEHLPITERTRLRRSHDRGRFDRAAIYAILDAMPLCHVGYIIDDKPAVTPTLQWREGDHVYWHGSSASRAVRASEDCEVCLTVSLLDGLVLARSAFHHSVNYRSVMIFGRATKVVDPDVKAEKLRNLIEFLYPGRWDMLRPMTEQEAKATAVLSLPIEEASAKVRSGGPIDDEADYALPIWSGVIPIELITGAPQPDPRNMCDVKVPECVTSLKIG